MSRFYVEHDGEPLEFEVQATDQGTVTPTHWFGDHTPSIIHLRQWLDTNASTDSDTRGNIVEVFVDEAVKALVDDLYAAYQQWEHDHGHAEQ